MIHDANRHDHLDYTEGLKHLVDSKKLSPDVATFLWCLVLELGLSDQKMPAPEFLQSINQERRQRKQQRSPEGPNP